jgi:uncharacterized repeat protein (TIGR03803 family)
MSPDAGGGWTEKILHSFINNGRDGRQPYAGVVQDASGNLYGTTLLGGPYNDGTVFEMSPKAGGGWTERILHSFNRKGADGSMPNGSLILDGAGNLYGTTAGGSDFAGMVFEMLPKEGGGWTEKILCSFTEGSNLATPNAGVILDGAGNLYGTTQFGGMSGLGAVFECSPAEGGGWTATVLHSFNDIPTDGTEPYASLILDGSGNLYGTTLFGGAYGRGVVFELVRAGDGTWTETVLHSFNKNGGDGHDPSAGLIFDAAGNLYGTTISGGSWDEGTVFDLTPAGGGVWTETTLYAFQHRGGKDGHLPQGGLVFDTAGNLYGTTSEGGDDDLGTVFEITP